MALRISSVAVRQMPSSIGSVASSMKKSLECSTKPRPVSTGPPRITFMLLGGFRQLDLVGLLDDVELHQQFRKIDAAGRAIDDDAHGAFGRMRADIDHRAREARIVHHRHGDQHLAVEIAVAGRIVARVGSSCVGRPPAFFAVRSIAKDSHVAAYPDIGCPRCQSSFVPNDARITSNSMVCGSAWL